MNSWDTTTSPKLSSCDVTNFFGVYSSLSPDLISLVYLVDTHTQTHTLTHTHTHLSSFKMSLFMMSDYSPGYTSLSFCSTTVHISSMSSRSITTYFPYLFCLCIFVRVCCVCVGGGWGQKGPMKMCLCKQFRTLISVMLR